MDSIDRSKVWVVIAAFNEEHVLAETLKGVFEHCPNVIVVDDCSSDNTRAIAKATNANVLSHPINLGQGAALQTGIRYALNLGADYIVTFDADGQHDCSEILPMFSALVEGGCEVALGSRYLGKTVNMPFRRKVMLRAAILFTRATVSIKLTDVHNGFRILTRVFCESFEFTQNRMAHASEILEHIASHRFRFMEYPVTIAYTDYSVRKGQGNSNAIQILFELLIGRISK